MGGVRYAPYQQPHCRQFVQIIPPAVIIAIADLFPSMPVYLRLALERAIAAREEKGLEKGRWLEERRGWRRDAF